jgi:hypothetical protein
VFENKVLRRIFGPRKDEVTGSWRKMHNEMIVLMLYQFPAHFNFTETPFTYGIYTESRGLLAQATVAAAYRTIFRTLNTLLRVHSQKRGEKVICNRWHSAPIAFPVNVAEAALAKQADL